MNDEYSDLTPYVVVKLARSAHRDDIVRWVCEKRDTDWHKGEELVRLIEERNRAEIRRRRSPLLFTLSTLAVVAGLVWALMSFGGIVLPIWEIYRDTGGWIEAAAWLANFWMLFPQLLAGSGLAIGGFFGIAAVLKKRDQVDWVTVEEDEG